MRLLIKLAVFFLLFTFYFLLSSITHAVSNPLSVPNNHFGIHIISASSDESSTAVALVNSSGGDWGYITVLAESKDRDVNKWQQFFNDLRRRHLIPLVRLATQPVRNYWKRPYEGEEIAWADFLNNLTWPIQNRYVIIYNEPNQANEWGNTVDPADYAQTLNKTIDALKKKSDDFFVLNAGFDASAPYNPPVYMEEVAFLQKMNQAVPGIFNKLDGWASHSYPNPGFIGSPNGFGRGTLRTWYWELQQLRSLGVSKNLPVFITETGWKHAEGLQFDKSLPSAETVGNYYEQAFQDAFNNSRIVAVTPFLLNYQEVPFDHFSFKKLTGEGQKERILGVEFPQYYPQYQAIVDLPKTSGHPIQENKAERLKGEIYKSIVPGETYTINLTLKNIGQSIWNDYNQVKLAALSDDNQLNIKPEFLPKDKKIEPGQDYTFSITITAPKSGLFKVVLNLFEGEKKFDSDNIEFNTEAKDPVILKIHSKLAWKKHFDGTYTVKIVGLTGERVVNINLDADGNSHQVEARYLLPDYTFDFTLQKPYYKPKTIRQKVSSGINNLDFGELQPDFAKAIFHPKELWKLLPFSD